MAIQRAQVVQTAEKYVSRGKIEPAIRATPPGKGRWSVRRAGQSVFR